MLISSIFFVGRATHTTLHALTSVWINVSLWFLPNLEILSVRIQQAKGWILPINRGHCSPIQDNQNSYHISVILEGIFGSKELKPSVASSKS